MMKLGKCIEILKDSDYFSILFKIIVDINTDLKNLSDDKTYSVYKGTYYAMRDSLYKSVSNLNIDDNKSIKRKLKTEEQINKLKKYISNLSGEVNGNNLFQFLKIYKKEVEKIVIYPSHFELVTKVDEIKFSSSPIDVSNNPDLSSYKRLKRYEPYLCGTKTFTYEEFTNLKNSRLPTIIKYNDKENKDYKLIVTYKNFIGFKAASECTMKFYKSKINKELFISRFVIKNPYFNHNIYLLFVNF